MATCGRRALQSVAEVFDALPICAEIGVTDAARRSNMDDAHLLIQKELDVVGVVEESGCEFGSEIRAFLLNDSDTRESRQEVAKAIERRLRDVAGVQRGDGVCLVSVDGADAIGRVGTGTKLTVDWAERGTSPGKPDRDERDNEKKGDDGDGDSHDTASNCRALNGAAMLSHEGSMRAEAPCATNAAARSRPNASAVVKGPST